MKDIFYISHCISLSAINVHTITEGSLRIPQHTIHTNTQTDNLTDVVDISTEG